MSLHKPKEIQIYQRKHSRKNLLCIKDWRFVHISQFLGGHTQNEACVNGSLGVWKGLKRTIAENTSSRHFGFLSEVALSIAKETRIAPMHRIGIMRFDQKAFKPLTFSPHGHAVLEVDFVVEVRSATPGGVRPRHVRLPQYPQVHPCKYTESTCIKTGKIPAPGSTGVPLQVQSTWAQSTEHVGCGTWKEIPAPRSTGTLLQVHREYTNKNRCNHCPRILRYTPASTRRVHVEKCVKSLPQDLQRRVHALKTGMWNPCPGIHRFPKTVKIPTSGYRYTSASAHKTGGCIWNSWTSWEQTYRCLHTQKTEKQQNCLYHTPYKHKGINWQEEVFHEYKFGLVILRVWQ